MQWFFRFCIACTVASFAALGHFYATLPDGTPSIRYVEAAPRSPARISAYDGCGSGDEFDYGVAYTVVDFHHEEDSAFLYAIITSDEPGVVICSPNEKLVELSIGDQFILAEGKNERFADALQVFPR